MMKNGKRNLGERERERIRRSAILNGWRRINDTETNSVRFTRAGLSALRAINEAAFHAEPLAVKTRQTTPLRTSRKRGKGKITFRSRMSLPSVSYMTLWPGGTRSGKVLPVIAQAKKKTKQNNYAKNSCDSHTTPQLFVIISVSSSPFHLKSSLKINRWACCCRTECCGYVVQRGRSFGQIQLPDDPAESLGERRELALADGLHRTSVHLTCRANPKRK